jgi:hypothetical protein
VASFWDPNWYGALAAIASFASAFAAFITVVQSSQTSRKSLEVTRRSSQESLKSFQQSARLDRTIEVMVHCNERYSRLQEEISIADHSDASKFKSLMTKYWSLKSDQFDYWLAGFVDPDAFFTWFSSTAKHFFDDDGLWEGKSFREGWEHGKNYHQGINPWFVSFISCLELAYQKGRPGTKVDQDYAEMKVIIDEMEGSPDSPGLARIFREVYSQGISWEEYKSFKSTTDNQEFLPQSFSRLNRQLGR